MMRSTPLLSAMFLAIVVAIAAMACGEDAEQPTPVLVGGGADAGDDAAPIDGLVGPGSSVECTAESYPCGPYGHLPCERIRDHRFVPANDAARSLAGEDGLLDMHDLWADETISGILLYGTAGWCSACVSESLALNDIYADYQPIPGTTTRAEFIAVVFEDGDFEPASLSYASRYADRYEFDFPVVADPSGDILYYFDAASTPGNIFIDATTMTLFHVAQGFDESSLRAAVRELDGTVECRE